MTTVKVMEISDFVEKEGLDIDDFSKESMSISINSNKVKYIKYLSYKTGKTMSNIVESLMCLNFEELHDSEETTLFGGSFIDDIPMIEVEHIKKT